MLEEPGKVPVDTSRRRSSDLNFMLAMMFGITKDILPPPPDLWSSARPSASIIKTYVLYASRTTLMSSISKGLGLLIAFLNAMPDTSKLHTSLPKSVAGLVDDGMLSF